MRTTVIPDCKPEMHDIGVVTTDLFKSNADTCEVNEGMSTGFNRKFAFDSNNYIIPREQSNH